MEKQIQELTQTLALCLNEIQTLKLQNQQQEQQINAMNQTFHIFSDSFAEIANSVTYLENTANDIITAFSAIESSLNSISEIVDGNGKSIYEHSSAINELIDFSKNTNILMQRLESWVGNIKYEILDPHLDSEEYFYPNIINSSIAIDKIIQERKSIARFGDGEFAIMMKVKRQKFQKIDDKLSLRLYEVLHSSLPDLLIGIANNYGSLDKFNATGALGIRLYMNDMVRNAHKKLLDPNREYYDAYMSRPYALYKDNQTDAPKKRFEHLQQIWEDRDVIFIEGALTRLGVGNDLFSNTRSSKRIIAPATNSFDKYDEILEAALQSALPDTLFLLAIGPSAGVLAYDLCANGYQAVDIGHVDLEYEWFLQGTGGRCAIPTKYNNELSGGDLVADVDDPIYTAQIICSFA